MVGGNLYEDRLGPSCCQEELKTVCPDTVGDVVRVSSPKVTVRAVLLRATRSTCAGHVRRIDRHWIRTRHGIVCVRVIDHVSASRSGPQCPVHQQGRAAPHTLNDSARINA